MRTRGSGATLNHKSVISARSRAKERVSMTAEEWNKFREEVNRKQRLRNAAAAAARAAAAPKAPAPPPSSAAGVPRRVQRARAGKPFYADAGGTKVIAETRATWTHVCRLPGCGLRFNSQWALLIHRTKADKPGGTHSLL